MERTLSLQARRRQFLRSAGAAVVLVPLAEPALASDPASDLISATAAQVIDVVKTTTGAAREAAIRSVLQNRFDLPYMAQVALGAHWAKATPEQQARFVKATETAEARAYAERFGQYAGQTLTIGKTVARPNNVYVVDSRLNQSNGQPIKLEWEVRQGAQGLRITDVKVEGVSMVMTRRSDFNSYIQSNGGKVQPLIDELEARASR
ncbi:MAG: ABC transporter substrate-binding protein [Alphaproteobacteria bacterium]|nr:ABC transporter substrate-binding protein [Alphaproteobacteria bacterium]